MDGGTEVVEESRQGEFESACGASGLRLGFEDVDLKIALGEGDGRGEAVGAGPDYRGRASGLCGGVHGSEFTYIVRRDRNAQQLWTLCQGGAQRCCAPTATARDGEILISKIIGGVGVRVATRLRLCGRFRYGRGLARSCLAIGDATIDLDGAFLALR